MTREEQQLRLKITKSLDSIFDNTFKLCEIIKANGKAFTWDDFKARKVAINCTRDNAQSFLKRCDEQGYHFTHSDYPDLVSWFERISYLYDEEVCFMFNNNSIGGLCHSDKVWFKSEGFDVVEYKDIPFIKALEDYSDQELVAELLKRHK